MKIVILDGFTTNPGDISWAPLAALGEVEVYDDTPAELIVERACDADILIYCRIKMTAQILAQLPKLRYIGTLSTGVNSTDLPAAASLGIPVCNVPVYCLETVAQFAVALMLGLANRVESYSNLVTANRWDDCFSPMGPVFSFLELSGKTLGLYGYGNIARKVAAVARGLGMKVIAYRRNLAEEEGVTFVSKDELLAQSDVISLHCPLTAETTHIFDAQTLAKMKKGALLINTARGAVIVEQAVADALQSGQLGGYAGDVFETEPNLTDSPLRTAPNVILTPHIAWASKDARQRLIDEVTLNLKTWIDGGIRNKVN